MVYKDAPGLCLSGNAEMHLSSCKHSMVVLVVTSSPWLKDDPSMARLATHDDAE